MNEKQQKVVFPNREDVYIRFLKRKTEKRYLFIFISGCFSAKYPFRRNCREKLSERFEKSNFQNLYDIIFYTRMPRRD